MAKIFHMDVFNAIFVCSELAIGVSHMAGEFVESEANIDQIFGSTCRNISQSVFKLLIRKQEFYFFLSLNHHTINTIAGCRWVQI